MKIGDKFKYKRGKKEMILEFSKDSQVFYFTNSPYYEFLILDWEHKDKYFVADDSIISKYFKKLW